MILYIPLHFTELFKIYINFLEKTSSPKNKGSKEARKGGREISRRNLKERKIRGGAKMVEE